jgi:16S rRNA (cytosine967-C5)-methyltransferase
LCETTDSMLLQNLRPEWNEKIALPVLEKMAIAVQKNAVQDIFPFHHLLSEGIDREAYCLSMLVQPDLFIRIRPQAKNEVMNKLEQSGFQWQLLSEYCVRLRSADKVADFFELDKEVVIQDANSQRVLDYLQQPGALAPAVGNRQLSVWDCCAASGGKSILLMDALEGKVELTVSDIRESILANLHLRFKTAGITGYESFVADISSAAAKPSKSDFDLIICDAPCSGSGTWGRTPEQLSFFNQAAVQTYADLQQKIVANAMPQLKSGGLFVYITCSVFQAENESVANFIEESLHCQLLDRQLLAGYHQRSDSMFVAVFRKG